jgi:hypothetical protein
LERRIKAFRRILDSRFYPNDLTSFEDFDEVKDVEACKKNKDI